MKGYIKLYRQTLNSAIWQDPYYLKLWMYCLMKASHKKREYLLGNDMIELNEGEFVTGRNSLEEDLNKGMKPKQKLSESTWWRYLINLEKWEMLNIKKTNKYSVVTVVNWSLYQGSEQQLNNSWTTDEQQLNTNKNVKNVENVKNEKESIPYASIIEYLNEKSGRKFNHKSAGNKKLIKARWNEGHNLDDFKQVIDVCSYNWKGKDFGGGKLGDQYLQPSTLFNGKFDERLNWTKDKKKEVSSNNNKSNSVDSDLLGINVDWGVNHE